MEVYTKTLLCDARHADTIIFRKHKHHRRWKHRHYYKEITMIQTVAITTAPPKIAALLFPSGSTERAQILRGLAENNTRLREEQDSGRRLWLQICVKYYVCRENSRKEIQRAAVTEIRGIRSSHRPAGFSMVTEFYKAMGCPSQRLRSAA